MIGSVQLSSACNMMAVLANRDSLLYTIHSSDNNLVLGEFNAFKNQGYDFDDGWSLIYYNNPIITSNDQIIRSPSSTYYSNLLYDSTVSAILSPDNNTYLALGHLRLATSGAEGIPNPHPFIFELNGATYAFSHNGTISKQVLLDLLTDYSSDSSWINLYPPSTYGHGAWWDTGWDYVVDSELLFLWLMKNIVNAGGNVISGLETALTALDQVLPSSAQKTFILSDGSNLFLYGSNSNLYYTSGNDTLMALPVDMVVHYKAVMSEFPNTGIVASFNWIPLMNDQIVFLSPDTIKIHDLTTSRIYQNNIQEISIKLEQNFPNPFNRWTMIEYYLPIEQSVKLSVFDLRGCRLRILVDQVQSAGLHSINWNARNDLNKRVSSGIYLYQIQTADYLKSRPMILVK